MGRGCALLIEVRALLASWIADLPLGIRESIPLSAYFSVLFKATAEEFSKDTTTSSPILQYMALSRVGEYYMMATTDPQIIGKSHAIQKLVVDGYKSTLGPKHHFTLTATFKYATSINFSNTMEDMEEAGKTFHELVEVQREMLGEDSHHCYDLMQAEALVLFCQKLVRGFVQASTRIHSGLQTNAEDSNWQTTPYWISIPWVGVGDEQAVHGGDGTIRQDS